MNPLLYPLFSKIVDVVGSLVDPNRKAEAQLALLKLQQESEFKDIDAALKELEFAKDNITSEAQSQDKWTSRTRPSFMYVIYLLILASIPMGVLYAFYPASALAITSGFKGWLSAIPDSMLTLFGAGYLGYTGARSLEKIKRVNS